MRSLLETMTQDAIEELATSLMEQWDKDGDGQ